MCIPVCLDGRFMLQAYRQIERGEGEAAAATVATWRVNKEGPSLLDTPPHTHTHCRATAARQNIEVWTRVPASVSGDISGHNPAMRESDSGSSARVHCTCVSSVRLGWEPHTHTHTRGGRRRGQARARKPIGPPPHALLSLHSRSCRCCTVRRRGSRSTPSLSGRRVCCVAEKGLVRSPTVAVESHGPSTLKGSAELESGSGRAKRSLSGE